VFTDIVGSTAMNARLGNDVMMGIRNRHFARVRALAKDHSGCEIKSLGDGFLLAFRSSVEALDFALRLHADTGDPAVAVRVGIHVGVFRIEDHDAFGSAVNYAARVASTANKGEIVMSDRAFKDAEEERVVAHTGLTWVQNDSCELKGFEGSHRLWTLSCGGDESRHE